MNAPPGSYRGDIDGLRAVAVLPVLFYHARIAGFGGGYAGVDVFFVISGFLITGILDREMQAGKFSLLRFYERRARRILPALFAVCLAVTLGAWLWFMPRDLIGFADSLMATMGFASNFLFWDEGGYFARPAEWKPLLHTWSLAVEEQFYLAFPLFLLGVRRVFGRAAAPVIAGCGLVSFAACLSLTASDPDAAFYLPHVRAWELLLGTALALGWVPPVRSRRGRDLLGGVGLACLAWAFTAFSETTAFPGPYALVPCLGTAMLIHSNASGPSFAGRLLSLRPLVELGLVSYSLYLWHWPILVFARYQAGRSLSEWETAAALLGSLGLAVLSHRFVEQPFRGRRARLTRRQVFATSGGVATLLGLLGFAGHQADGFEQRWPDSVLAYANTLDPQPKCSLGSPDALTRLGPCVIGEGRASEANLIVWGDSHVDSMLPAFEQLAKQRREPIALASFSGCPPLLGVDRIDNARLRCAETNAILSDWIRDHALKQVLLVARWATYALGHEPGGMSGNPTLMGNARHTLPTRESSQAAYDEGWQETLAFLESEGLEIFVFYQPPDFLFRVPNALARAVATGQPVEAIGRPRAEHDARRASVREPFARAAREDRLMTLDPVTRLCDPSFCFAAADGEALYIDSHHLSPAGARRIADTLDPLRRR